MSAVRCRARSRSLIQGPDRAPARGDADGWALLDTLRRKLDDQTAQGRRTHDQVQQLTESIGALVAGQRRRTRWLNLNSFGAYLLFTVLCGTAAVALYSSRSNELVDARDRALADRDAATHRADAAEQKLAALAAADARRAALDAARTIPNPAAERDAQVKAAIAAFKAQHYVDARPPLEAALAAEPSGSRAPALHYYLGVIALGDGRLDAAVKHLDAAIRGRLRRGRRPLSARRRPRSQRRLRARPHRVRQVRHRASADAARRLRDAAGSAALVRTPRSQRRPRRSRQQPPHRVTALVASPRARSPPASRLRPRRRALPHGRHVVQGR